MSIGSVIQQLFGGAATTPQSGSPQQIANMNSPMQTQQPGMALPGTVANAFTSPNGMIPANDGVQQLAPGQEPIPLSPLDAFKDVWNTPVVPVDPNAPVPVKTDPNKVFEAARKVEFAKSVTPEMMAQIAKGGPEAQAALIAIMNHTSQNVYAQSALATKSIVEKALSEQADSFRAELPNLVRKFSANENVRTESPLLSHPAVQPLVPALTEMFTRKNPNATSTEISAQVSDYFKSLGSVFAPPNPNDVAASKAAAGTTDWSKFLE